MEIKNDICPEGGGGSKVPLRLLKNGLKIHLISLPDCRKRVLHIDEL